jgi:predicted GNAT superfamily acetyltransferase
VPTPSGSFPAAATAEHEADEAAERAQVRIAEPCDEADARLISQAGTAVWGPRGTLAPNELQALVHAGSPVHLATDLRAPGQPVVGFALGFLGWTPSLHVHSHQVGVIESQRRRGIGYALKLAQRTTCLARGLTDMRWTFDPLVRRNTYFNVEVLGARAATFHPDFYGDMTDQINAGDVSDRLEAVWTLTDPLPLRDTRAAHAAPTDEGQVPLLVERAGWPHPSGAEPRAGALLPVPADYERLRRDQPDQARAWRTACREVLQSAYGAGLEVTRVTGAGYTLDRPEEAR